ncbi:MAG TPA: family 20 glycosylhydrolase [Kiritimatiellia bacterium]|nr:family 20 glycosylhydrolase [Kiritimatiellia bacterium]HRU69533.1 family 20 glycosylhydrolase [Kiritimatiellia bacterium]
MKKQRWTVMVVCACVACVWSAAPLNGREAGLIKTRLVPAPQRVELSDGPEVVLDDTLTVALACAKEGDLAQKQVRAWFKAWFGCRPKVIVVESDDTVPQLADAYRISAAKGALRIEAADAGGARNAMRTLRQLAEPVRGTRTVTAYFIPETVIDDAPAMAFRGFHLCWFPENTPVEIERYIRLAAYYKMNYIVLESWGMFVFKNHPELSWPDSPMTRSEVKRLVKIANELGVTLIPQLNLFGHASGSRIVSGKHVILDFNPSLQPLFEPQGWTWCHSNPEAVALLEELVLELHDAFGRPPYFHAGCDEAYDMGTCTSCRRSDYPRVVAACLTRIHDALAARQCRMMVWHDMLLRSGDPRWKGYYAYGASWADALLDALPRDVVICDWFYRSPVKGEKEDATFPTLRHFKSKGFPVLACPWENREGYEAQSGAVRSLGLDGMLSTTWHHLYGLSMQPIYWHAAHAMWGTRPLSVDRLVFTHHLRQVGWDIPVKKYRDTGFFHHQLPENNHSPR